MQSLIKTHPLLKIFNSSLIDLPSPGSLSSFWNFGSLLGLCLGSQIITGLFLAIHYAADVRLAFERVSHISRDVQGGWLLRALHANGARAFFACLYLHIGRGLYYGSYRLHLTWSIGRVILLLTIAAAFIGYVLPWGQISFWGATVITNLFSAIPLIGPDVVGWIWGGFAVDNATLTRFFALHFLLPFLITAIVGVHLLFLHQTGSNNPLGVNSNLDKVPFHPYFSFKDAIGFSLLWGALVSLSLLTPWLLGDPENFIPANPLVTPVHIQPEWYFLFAYAILRSIPNKLGGVLALAGSVLILLVLPLLPIPKTPSIVWHPLIKLLFWRITRVVILLTWIGARPVEEPYVLIGQGFTVIYFSYFMTSPFIMSWWENL